MRMYSIKLLFLLAVIVLTSNAVYSQTAVRSFFKLVPAEYFNIACCEGNVEEFAKKYVTVEDNESGYMKGADIEEDPKYAGFELKVFRAKNKTIVGLYSSSINWNDYYFLELRGKKLVNISLKIPQYSLDNIYEFPRKSNLIKVYRKKYANADKTINADGGVSKGKFLYNLVWQNGAFILRK